MDEKYVELFIDMVRARPVIWQKRDKGYKDSRGVKNNNYKEIVACLSSTYPEANPPFTGTLAQSI